jgi:hypothetical protein
MGKVIKLSEEDYKFNRIAAEVAWTPCKHFFQCIGFCPLCLRDYLKKEEGTRAA